MHKTWRPWAQAVVLIVAGGFLIALVVRQWSALQAYRWRLAPEWALLALIGLELTWLFELDAWRMILRGLGAPLAYRTAAPIWFLSNIVRYIPGNIWQFLGMAELAHEAGAPRLTTLTSIILHQAISTAAGVAFAAAYFALFDDGEWLRYLRPALLIAPLGLLLLQPRLLEGALNWLLRRLGRPAIRVSLTGRQIVLLVGRYLGVWTMMGLSFAALTRGLAPLDWPAAAYLVAAWAAAYVIGYLTLLTPAGLGVREGALVLFLLPIMPAGAAAVVAIVARLWMVVGEALGAGAALIVRGQSWRRE